MRRVLYLLAPFAMAACATAGSPDVGDDVVNPDGAVINTEIDARRIDAAPIDAMPIDAIPIDAAPTCTVQTVQVLLNPGYDLGHVNWSEFPSDASYPLIDNLSGAGLTPQAGGFGVWMGGFLSATDRMYQDVAIPASATAVTITGYRWLGTEETTTVTAYDTVKLEVRNNADALLSTLATWSNLNTTTAWTAFSFSAGSVAGQTIRINLTSTTDFSNNTNFFFDTFVLNVTACL